MTDRFEFVFWSNQPFSPNRVRSFLQYLAGLEPPFRASALPRNLYIASENFLKECEPLFFELTNGRSVRLSHERLSPDSQSIRFGLGEARGLACAGPLLEILGAGGRILSAEIAYLADPDTVVPFESGEPRFEAMPP